MSTVLPIVGPQRNDRGLLVVITIRRPNGTIVDLTGSTAYVMVVRQPTGAMQRWTLTLFGQPSAGQLQYTPTAEEFAQPGRHYGQVIVTAPTREWRTQPFWFVVGDNI